MTTQLREELASLSHDIWAHWMKYMYRKANFTKTGAAFWKVEDIQHWKRQMKLSYDELTQKEKDSDREQADKILKVLCKHQEEMKEKDAKMVASGVIIL